jgi:hypothetical protein|tara:strand:+ start:918 stop:1166 length:249 start_codon:yes stop_codon:yes gene_type:complete
MVKLIENLGESYKKVVWKFIVKVNDIKVGVVYESDNNDEGFTYYKFIDGKFSYEELEDDVLSDDDKFEIEEVFYTDALIDNK